MTAGEIRALIADWPDDRYVTVTAHHVGPPDPDFVRHQLVIQGVELYEPWHNGLDDKSNWLGGIVVSLKNKEIGRS